MPVKPDPAADRRELLGYLVAVAVLVLFLAFYAVHGQRYAYAFLIAALGLPALGLSAFWLSDRLHSSRHAALHGLGWCVRAVGGLLMLVGLFLSLAQIIMA